MLKRLGKLLHLEFNSTLCQAAEASPAVKKVDEYSALYYVNSRYLAYDRNADVYALRRMES
jgi:hypothetical protein